MVYYETLARGCQSVQSGNNVATRGASRDLQTCSASATGNTILESVEAATIAISRAFVEGFATNYDIISFFVYQTDATFTTKILQGSQPPSPPQPTPSPPQPTPSPIPSQKYSAITSITTTAYLLSSPETTRILILSDGKASAPTKAESIALAGLAAAKQLFAEFTTNPKYSDYQIMSSNASTTTSIVAA